MASFRPKFRKVWFSEKIKNYMPNELIQSHLSFSVFFSIFRENNTFQNLNRNDAIAFFYQFLHYIK